LPISEGGGVSGIGAAKVLKQNGYDVVVYERGNQLGGIWSIGYQDVNIQSFDFQYHYTDFPWPKDMICSPHPTPREVLHYLQATVEYYELNVRLNHTVISMEERSDGWILCVSHALGKMLKKFDYVIVSSGLFTEGKYRPVFEGQEVRNLYEKREARLPVCLSLRHCLSHVSLSLPPPIQSFQGDIVTERDITSPETFQNQKVLVLGYGKSALDMAVLSASRSLQTYHVFRQPRWTLPETLFGFPSSYLLFSRLGTSMISSWAQPTKYAQLLHTLKAIVHLYWTVIGWLFKFQSLRFNTSNKKEVHEAILVTHPSEPLMEDKRFVVAKMPEEYYPFVVSQKIKPMHAGIKRFVGDGVELTTGERVCCDMVILSLGNQTPSFPFLPEKQRWMLEREGGAQLYRHVLHPKIPRMGFIGLNHCFLHMPAVEIGTLWLIASWRGELELPSVEVTSLPLTEADSLCLSVSLSASASLYQTGNGSKRSASCQLEEG
jgi:dimethylaniline monooxygenase (N-oxide forming)